MESSYLIKQHSNHWHQLRKKAVVTRRTGFAALGLKTLNKQKQYYEKVFEGKDVPLSDEKRDLFEYRSKNEINKLATLVGKYLPVFLPHIIFLKMVVELSTWRMTRTVIAMQSAAVMVLVFRLTGLLCCLWNYMPETWQSSHHWCVLQITSILFHPSFHDGRDGNWGLWSICQHLLQPRKYDIYIRQKMWPLEQHHKSYQKSTGWINSKTNSNWPRG